MKKPKQTDELTLVASNSVPDGSKLPPILDTTRHVVEVVKESVPELVVKKSEYSVPHVDVNVPLPDSRSLEEVKDTVMIAARRQYYFGIAMLVVFLAIFTGTTWGYTKIITHIQAPTTNVEVSSPSPVPSPIASIKPVFAVWNASGVAGAAGKMAEKLKAAGYEVIETKNAPTEQAGTTLELTVGLAGQEDVILNLVGIKDGIAKPGLPDNLEYSARVIIGK